MDRYKYRYLDGFIKILDFHNTSSILGFWEDPKESQYHCCFLRDWLPNCRLIDSNLAVCHFPSSSLLLMCSAYTNAAHSCIRELTESLFLPGAILEAFYYGISNSNIFPDFSPFFLNWAEMSDPNLINTTQWFQYSETMPE